jgi:hypothetical protein
VKGVTATYTLAVQLFIKTKIAIMSEKNFKISLTEGKGFTQNWINKGKVYASDLRAFTVKIPELINILSELSGIPIQPLVPPNRDLNAVRFYTGVKILKDGTNAPCLVMVGVEGFNSGEENPDDYNPGKEVYSIKEGVVNAANYDEGDADDSGLYDFAYPCPDTCTLNSPLMHSIP